MNSIQLQEDHLSCKGSFEHARIVLSNFSPSVQLENVITLQVDEMILRKAFSPFGEIEKITAFPGRSYAFVLLRSEISACRAKEALQGRLFGNPRIHICFAKSETGSANSGRNSMNVPPSPHFQVNGRSGSSEYFWEDTKFGSFTGNPSIRSPQYFPDFDAGDSDPCGFKRKGNLWRGESDTFEQRRYGEMGSEP
ncbi:hypothetical protein ACFX2I_024258 [Malus domestica]